MGAFDNVMGAGSVAEQFLIWGIANQVATALLGPYFEELTELVNARTPVTPIAPADLADMVVKNILDEASAATEAAKSGVPAGDLRRMVQNTGEPIGLEQGLEAVRRGFLNVADAGPGTVSLERLVKTSRIYNEWLPVIEQLSEIPISVGEAVDAVLRGQTDRATGEAEAFANGINATRFQILLDSAGRPPAPVEAAKLVHRGLIPLAGTGPDVTSFQQAIYEGDSKNKWWQLLFDGEEYLPPPRTVTALLKTGSLSVEQAQRYFVDAGMTPELAAAYVHNASGEKLAGTRQLAESTVLALYNDHAIDTSAATAHLGALGYDATDAALILEVADLQRELRAVTGAITRVHTLYVARKITRTAATNALAALEMSPAHAAHLLGTWDVELAVNVKQLTHADITAAWDYGNMDTNEAMAELQAIGYTPFDAWVLISNKAKGPQPGRPAPGPGGPGVLP